MDKIAKAKNEFRLRQWTQMIRDCQESGMTVVAWCEQNDIKPKSYYYWLRRIRTLACENNTFVPTQNNHQIVPVALKHTGSSTAVTIHLSSISVDIHDGAARETIETVLAALKSIC
ncbi:MAG: IS66 family insertion sequence element accessory protein TnpB [Clostridia bacterium]|nr:IS66 family insertion sequence element accessory protein TnpB [Clostridia bacterium]